MLLLLLLLAVSLLLRRSVAICGLGGWKGDSVGTLLKAEVSKESSGVGDAYSICLDQLITIVVLWKAMV